MENMESPGIRCSRIARSVKASWGMDDWGELGDGEVLNPQRDPVPEQILTDVKLVAAGYCHAIAVRTDGTLWGWGSDERGALGDGELGTPDKNPTPYQIIIK